MTTPSKGIFFDIPDEEYFAIDAHSQSGLKPLLTTAAEYKYRQQFGVKATDAMTWGKALDQCVTADNTSVLCKPPWVIAPDSLRMDKRTEKYKAWSKKVGLTDDSLVLKESDAAAIQAAFDALKAHVTIDGSPTATELLWSKRAHAQVTLIWEDDIGLCKARCDVLHHDHGIVDLKTTSKPLSSAGKSVAKYGYHIQAAWYLRGWEKLTGQRVPFWVVWCKSTPVHQVETGIMSADAVQVGSSQIETIMQRWQQCNQSGHWPATTGVCHEYALPRYYKE